MTTSYMTDAGVGVPAATTEQMREVDRVAIGKISPNLYQTVENVAPQRNRDDATGRSEVGQPSREISGGLAKTNQLLSFSAEGS